MLEVSPEFLWFMQREAPDDRLQRRSKRGSLVIIQGKSRTR